jgi:hypothetical protein
MGLSPTEKTRSGICPAAIILRDKGTLHAGLTLFYDSYRMMRDIYLE